MVVSLKKLIDLKLIKHEHFSTGRPFETIHTWFPLRNHYQFGWSYPAQPVSEETLLSPNFQLEQQESRALPLR